MMTKWKKVKSKTLQLKVWPQLLMITTIGMVKGLLVLEVSGRHMFNQRSLILSNSNIIPKIRMYLTSITNMVSMDRKVSLDSTDNNMVKPVNMDSIITL